jgi:chloramphenicol O-acetyltransferase type A
LYQSLRYRKSKKRPRFLFTLHKTLAAVNHIECFKYRTAEDNVYDQINASATIGRADGTFGFP